MLVRYGKNFRNEIIKDKQTIRNILSLVGHQTEIVDNEVVIIPRNTRNVCSTFKSDMEDLNVSLYGLSAIDEQYPSSEVLDKFYVELVVETIANTVTLNIDKSQRERIRNIYQDLVKIDFGTDTTGYIIPIPRIERKEDKTVITVIGENWILDYLTDTYLPFKVEHVSTINNHSMVKIEIDDADTFDMKWLMDRLNTIHTDDRNVKIDLNPLDLYFDEELCIQRALVTALIQDEFKNVSNEEVFEVILNLI